MYRSILVPLDGTPFGEQALPWAEGIAAVAGAELRLVHVHTPLVPVPYLEGLTPYQFEGVEAADHEHEEEARAREAAYLEGLAEEIARRRGVAVRTSLLEGDVTARLEACVAAGDVDLVVMATHGRSGLERAWFGSVADYLLRHCSVPLVLVRTAPGEARPAEPFRHILVPLDGSLLSEQILAPALRLGRVLGSRFTLLHVASPPLRAGEPYSDVAAGLEPAASVGRRVEAVGWLEAKAAELRAEGLEAQAITVVHSQPAEAIVDVAVRLGAGVVAMATHGRGGLTRLLAGSVTDRVIHATHGAMLVQRPCRESRGNGGEVVR